MIEQWIIKEPFDEDIKQAVIGFSGRGIPAELMVDVMEDFYLPETLIVSVQPYGLSWYPQPTSSEQQEDTVKYLPAARKVCLQSVNRISKGFNLPLDRIALVGYSAGGVMAIQSAIHISQPLAAAVCLCGAVFEPDKIPKASKKSTPILLVHSYDDACFDWEERYLPMKQGLKEKGYKVYVKENEDNGHMITRADVMDVSKFLGLQFGYKNWDHPKRKTFLNKYDESQQETGE